ncbi:MAG TPA: hypothetical protein VNK41_05775 [Vicinamibacterales bacterium]|nr:hypothetical protein [Vicinamibacterales bacterium]
MLLVSPALLLTSPVIEALGALNMSLLTKSALRFTGGLAVLGLCLGGLAAFLRPDPPDGLRRQVAFVLVLAVIGVTALDVLVGGHIVVRALLPATETWAPVLRAAVRMGLLGVLALVLAGVMWPLRLHAHAILFAFAAVVFAATALSNVKVLERPGSARPIPPASTGAIDAPPFLYIVLDEAMGIDGLEIRAGGEAVVARLRSLTRHGFRVYERSFSRHWTSRRAISDAINFDFTDQGWKWELPYQRNGRATSALFERLARSGYEVVSYGTAPMEFCFPEAHRCETFSSFDPYSAFLQIHETNPRSISNDSGFRAGFLYQTVRARLAESYLLFRYGALLLRLEGLSVPESIATLDPFAFPAWFDRFAADVAASPRGRAYFAHLLAPHGPYVLDASCRETGEPVRTYFDGRALALTGQAAVEYRDHLYAAYFEQYQCVITKLEAFLTRLETLPQFRDATIVIHGDHGSRISAEAAGPPRSANDLIDRYSAFFAIRAPGVSAGLDRRHASVQRLVAEYLSGMSVEDPEGPETVVVEDEPRAQDKSKVRVMRMPSDEAPSHQTQ